MGRYLDKKLGKEKPDSAVFHTQEAIAAMRPNPMTPDGKRLEVKFSEKRMGRK